MTEPDPAAVHDIRTIDNGLLICAKCYRIASRRRSWRGRPGAFPGRCEPEAVTHLPAHRDGLAALRCGAPWGSGAIARDDAPVTCPDCRSAMDAQPRLRGHDLRAWGPGALCARCGERAGDPDTLAFCAPPAEGRYAPCAASDPLDPDGTSLCGKQARANLPFVTLLRRDAHAAAAGCAACLEAARGLPPYGNGAHDLRLHGDGVICPTCGIAAATPEDAGGCAGDALVGMLRRRNAGGGALAGTISAIVHAPAGGCRHAPVPDAGRIFWGNYYANPSRTRVTCLNCIRLAARLPRAPSLAAQP